MKKITLLFLYLSIASTCLFAGSAPRTSLLGQTFNNTFGTPDPDLKCARATGNPSLGPCICGASVPACPGKACDEWGFASDDMLPWESYRFKNTSGFPICLSIQVQRVSGATLQSFATGVPFVPTSTIGQFCPLNPVYYGDYPLFISATGTWGVTIPACTDFELVVQNIDEVSLAGTAYNITINSSTPNATLLCGGAECIKTLTLGGSPVPTMTQWGLFLFGLIVLTLGVVAVFNMSRRSNSVKS